MDLSSSTYWIQGALVLWLTIALLLYLWVKKRYRFFEERGVPYVKPPFLVGSTWKVLLGVQSMTGAHKKLYKQMKNMKVGGIFQFLSPFFTIQDPNIIHRILIKDFSHFHDRGVRIDEKTNPLEGHLFLLEGEKWRTLRIKLSPTFTSGKLKWMYGQMQACADILLGVLDKKIQSGKVLDVKETLACFTTDVIGSCVFGYEPQSLKNPNNDFRKMSHEMLKPGIYYFLIGVLRLAFPDLFFKWKIKTVPPHVNDFFVGTMMKTMNYRRESGYKRNDFVQLLLQLKDKGSIDVDPFWDYDDDHLLHVNGLVNDHAEEKIVLTDELLVAQAFVFFVAGFETSATSMSFTLYLLSRHPEAQEKARQEVRKVKEKHGGFTYEALKEMKYLEACFNEALRMYPPIGVLFRQCIKDIHMEEANITFQKGDRVIIPTIGLNYDPDIYPSPEMYKPERFLEMEETQQKAFIPFGDGPRICIGKRFAMVEAKLGLAAIIDRYNLTKSERNTEPLVFNPRAFMPEVKGGLWVNFSKAN